MPNPTKSQACGAVAKSLQEFGYPSVTDKMIGEIFTAWLSGKRDGDLPHGVIGQFAGRQFDEVEEAHPGYLASLKD